MKERREEKVEKSTVLTHHQKEFLKEGTNNNKKSKSNYQINTYREVSQN